MKRKLFPEVGERVVLSLPFRENESIKGTVLDILSSQFSVLGDDEHVYITSPSPDRWRYETE